MKIFLSLFCVIGFLCMDAFFAGLVIILGFMDNWVGMVKYYIAIVLLLLYGILLSPVRGASSQLKSIRFCPKFPLSPVMR